MEFTAATSQRIPGVLGLQAPLLKPSASLMTFSPAQIGTKQLIPNSHLMSPSSLVPPPPPLTPAPPLVPLQGSCPLKISESSLVSDQISVPITSSATFASALRSLTSSGLTTTQEVSKSLLLGDSMPPPPPLRPSSAVPQLTSEPAALLDVRRGFSKSSQPLGICSSSSSTLPSTSNSNSSQSSDLVSIGTGFQPYRSSESSLKDASNSSTASNVPQFTFNQTAPIPSAFGYHPSLYGSQFNSSYNLEMEALYRAQLDHFATGIARQPFLLYPSIGNPFQGSPLGLVQPQLSGIVMQPAGPTISTSKTPPLSLSLAPKTTPLSRKTVGKTSLEKPSVHEPPAKIVKKDTSAKERRNKEVSGEGSRTHSNVQKKQDINLSKYTHSNVQKKQDTNLSKHTGDSKMTILSIPEVPLGAFKSLEPTTSLLTSETKEVKRICSPKNEPKGYKTPVIPIIPNLDKLGIKKPDPCSAEIKLPTQPLDLSEVKSSSVMQPASNLTPSEFKTESYVAQDLMKSTIEAPREGVRDKSLPQNPTNSKLPFVRPFEDTFRNPIKTSIKGSISKSTKKSSKEATPPTRKVSKNKIVKMQSDDVSTSTQETHNHQQKILLNLIQAPQEKNFNEEKVGLRTEAKDLAIEPPVDSELAKLPQLSTTSDVESYSQDKLKYLRYFRLLSHRKRKVSDISSQPEVSKRTVTSPSLKQTVETYAKSNSPCLVPPHFDLLSQEWVHTSEKLTFLSSLGLEKLSESEKTEIDIIWDVLLDDRLSRNVDGNVTTTFLKVLKDCLNNDKLKEVRSCMNNTFLAPAPSNFSNQKDQSSLPLISHCHSQVPNITQSKTITPSEKPTSLPLEPDDTKVVDDSSKKVSLAINFSSLEPLSMASLQLDANVDTPMPPAVSASVKNQLRLSDELIKSESSASFENSMLTAVGWPGVQGIIESYSKYNKERSDKIISLQSKIRQLDKEIQSRRKQVDTLTTKMTNLTSNQANHQEKNTSLRNAIKLIEEILSVKSLE